MTGQESLFPDADFWSRQKVWDAFNDAREFLCRNEMIVAAHPEDVTDELREAISAAPLTTLRESRHIKRGTLFVIHPGLLEDIYGV